MLVLSRHSWILQFTVMLCVGLSFVLSNQSYIKLMDNTRHALHQEHAPNPLAGTVELSEHGHGRQSMRHHCDAEDHAIDSKTTHLHFDSSIVYIIAAVSVVATPSLSSFVPVAIPQELDRIYAYRLERPPKTVIAKYA